MYSELPDILSSSFEAVGRKGFRRHSRSICSSIPHHIGTDYTIAQVDEHGDLIAPANGQIGESVDLTDTIML